MICYKQNNGVVIPKLAIDTDFFRYSPGGVMIAEYIKQLSQNENKDYVFDLSRGAEQYKLSLGGELYYNYSSEILLE